MPKLSGVMLKAFWMLLLGFMFVPPAWSADLSVGSRRVHARIYVDAYHPRRIELRYPRWLPDYPRYSCWSWMPDGHIRLVPSDWSASCVVGHYYDPSTRPVLFVEHVRVR